VSPVSLAGPGRRVKVQGDLFHGRVPEGAVYIGRAAPGLRASPYANPYPVRIHGLEESLRLYRGHLAAHPELVAAAAVDLAGRAYACWCPAGRLCHGDDLADAISARLVRCAGPDEDRNGRNTQYLT
jgi:hypothetical protein